MYKLCSVCGDDIACTTDGTVLNGTNKVISKNSGQCCLMCLKNAGKLGGPT